MFSNDVDTIFYYLESIIEVSKRHNLSYKCAKCVLFTKKLDFVGIYVDVEGNKPAKFKIPLYKMWRTKFPLTTQDCASLVDLVGYYRQ